MNRFEAMLTGGHPNSLGNTEQVVRMVLDDPQLIKDLYATYQSSDEVVRLRVSSAFKRIAKHRPDLMIPLIDPFISEVSAIPQPSAKWTFTQCMMMLDEFLSDEQRRRVIAIIQSYLDKEDDWIVLNIAMEGLMHFRAHQPSLSRYLEAKLPELSKDSRKSVAKRASKYLALIGEK